MLFALIFLLIPSTVSAQAASVDGSDPGWSDTTFDSELYVGEHARRAILPRRSFLEIVYTNDSGESLRMEGRVVAMTDSTLTLASNRDVPLARVTRILVATSKAKLSQARRKFFG
jgi:hypothetical protein